MRWNKGNTCVFNVSYHLIWTPKYRASILKGYIQKHILCSLREKAESLKLKIEQIEVMPDHVHVFIKCNPKMSITKIVQYLKGYSSYKLRSSYPYFLKYKALWTRSYYCETIGHISEATIKRYIADQKK